MALVRVKGVLDHVLDKNLQDLVRGIRNHKDTEGKYISECIEEIKQELKQESLVVKANAINKLVLPFKRIGYLAASQSFHDGTDVIMLTTNLVRKDLNSTNTYDAGVALSSLSCFMTGDLAHDLANDIMVLMTSTKPYLRKKAVLLMYKVFLRFPDSLKPAFGRLKEKLEDPDPGVQSAAVNVICELARKNPQNYLSLAPLFFKLMTTSTNNWVLIKIIKLFGALIPLEPRLGKKLIEPLTNLIHSTSAMSLLYECINTVIAVLISISSGLQNHATSVQLCVQKLQILIEDSDQNLKYLGLLAMTKILKTHPKSVQAHKELIMQCLDDKDESIRLRALSLLYGMVSKKNLMEIVKKLILLSKIIGICSQNDYRFITNFEWYVSVLVELAAHKGMKPAQGRAIANQLLDVAIRVQQVRRFAARQMSLLLRNHTLLLGGGAGGSAGGGAGGGGSGSGGGATSGGGGGSAGLVEVLYAAAWICGEFAVCLAGDEESEDARRATLEAMSLPYVLQLPGEVQAVFVHNQVKLYANLLLAESDAEERVALTTELSFVHSEDLEVQERAVCAHQLLKCTAKALRQAAASKTAAIFDVGDVATEDGAGSTAEADGDAVIDRVAKELSGLFAGELNPVAPKAQRKVPLPEGLDLDAWINEPPAPPKSEFDEPVKRKSGKSSGRKKEPEAAVSATVGASASGATNYSSSDPTVAWGGASGGGFEQKEYHQPSEAELAAMRETRLREQESNPNYLKSSSSAKRLASDESNHFGRVQSQYEKPGEGLDDEDSQLPRVASMDSGMPTLRIEGLSSSDKYLMQHKQEQSKQKAMKLAEKAAASAVEDGKKKKKKKTKRQLMKEKAAAATSSSKPETNRDEDDEDDEEDDNLAGSHVVSTAYDMPENAAPDSDNEAEAGPGSRLAPDDPHRQLANIKIDDLVAMGGRGGAVSSTEFGNSAAEVAAATTKRKVATKKKKKSAAAGDDDAGLQEKPKKEKKKKGGEKKAGKKKKAKAAEASEDLLLLGLDDDAAVQPPRLWLPVGES
uniref:AP-3 complex subunit delta n=1 Tax=Macrostomum lignano TaxID=282301 RepID=A0A1I8J036_9PLAT